MGRGYNRKFLEYWVEELSFWGLGEEGVFWGCGWRLKVLLCKGLGVVGRL